MKYKAIFNQKMLENKLNNYKIDDIEQWAEKIKIINGWKKSIERKDLNKTKEKQLQGLFFTQIFCNVLNYTNIIGNNDWTFVQETNTKADATTPDGMLGFFDNKSKDIRVVIELKDALTDLDAKQKSRDKKDSPVEQAFSYAPKSGRKCNWIIVSNFKEIRLYHASTALEYERFLIIDLVTNSREFLKFFYLLNEKNLINKNDDSLTDILYKTNLEESKNISNAFYKEYKNTRLNLFKGIRENNLLIDELVIFEKVQKLMDRFIFICFCEDTQLLPKNTFKNVINTARNSYDPSDTKIWTQLKGLFYAIDKGNPPMDINKFNGGLFASDCILDKLYIPDNLFDGLESIAEYDFETDLNVNILGHIFEQSIGDIEDIKAEIIGGNSDKKNGKRKKDGVFYTPEYVTNYIVSKCIGDWLGNKRKELGEDKLPTIPEGDESALINVPIKNGRWKKNITEREKAQEMHRQFWIKYGEVLSSIKILDPACGSGAFLNAAFDYLYKEGNRVNEEHCKITNINSLFDLDKTILKNNLYGVDLNAESVEITKLSLWLKTANKKDQLTTLDNNIVCGNSLIDDINVVGEKAFNWNNSFKNIMDNGGFDIIIGNPPYGAKLNDAEKRYLDDNYETTQYNYDTYKFFFELSFRVCKNQGYIGFITPNTYLVLEKSNLLRKFLFDEHKLEELIELYNVFPDAVVEPIISIYIKKRAFIADKFDVTLVPRGIKLNSNFIYEGSKIVFSQNDLKRKDGYLFNYHETENERKISEKINKISRPLETYLNVSAGVKPYETNKGYPKQTKEIIKDKPYNGFEKIDGTWLEYMKGENIHKYTDKWDGEYIKYGECLAAPRKPEMFKNPKIFIRQTSDTLIATLDETGKICKNTLHCIYPNEENIHIDLKFILALLNSKLMNWKFQHDNFHIVGKALAETKITYINRLPIIYTKDVTSFVELVDKLLTLNQKKYNRIKEFIDYIEITYKPKKISKKISGFYKIEYNEFTKELQKQKSKLTEIQKFELMALFNSIKSEINKYERDIRKEDDLLNGLIYNLYNLTTNEIKVIENKYKHSS